MSRCVLLCMLSLSVMLPHVVQAGPKISKAKKVEPLKVLIITGGCCHDYTKQKTIISEGLKARANVAVTIVHEGGSSSTHRVSIHEKKDWANGYDVILHNECFAKVEDVEFIHNITEAHKAGVPAVMVHCAMHNYRGKTDEWFKLCGVTSRNHGRKHAIRVDAVNIEHPIMKGLPKTWTTPQGELYNIEKLWETATPLATGVSDNPSKVNTCVWVNQYGKARVFSTTLGHHNETMSEEVYLDLLARGLLWACDKLDDNGKPKPGFAGTGKVARPKKPEPQPTPAIP